MKTYILDEKTVQEIRALLFDDLAYYAQQEDHARGIEMLEAARVYGDKAVTCEKLLKIFS